jgi:DNA-binding protein YbaB
MFDGRGSGTGDLGGGAFGGGDLDAAARVVDGWEAGFEERATRARELSARLAQLRATARSHDELVTVTVGSSGDLIDLNLDERIRHRPAEETAREILTTLRAARGTLVAAVTSLTEETVGADSTTGQAIIASYAGRLEAPEA